MPGQSRWQSFRCALRGLAHVARTEVNAAIELVAVALVITAGVLLQLPARDWAVVALAIGGVLAAEMFNTAIESIVDLLSPEHHRLAGIAKDCGAGGVLIAVIAAAAAGLSIFVPALCTRFGST